MLDLLLSLLYTVVTLSVGVLDVFVAIITLPRWCGRVHVCLLTAREAVASVHPSAVQRLCAETQELPSMGAHAVLHALMVAHGWSGYSVFVRLCPCKYGRLIVHFAHTIQHSYSARIAAYAWLCVHV